MKKLRDWWKQFFGPSLSEIVDEAQTEGMQIQIDMAAATIAEQERELAVLRDKTVAQDRVISQLRGQNRCQIVAAEAAQARAKSAEDLAENLREQISRAEESERDWQNRAVAVGTAKIIWDQVDRLEKTLGLAANQIRELQQESRSFKTRIGQAYENDAVARG